MASKYKKGRRIKSLDDMMKQPCVIQWHRNQWKRFGDDEGVTVPNGWFQCWQLRYAMSEIKFGNLFVARRVEGKQKLGGEE